MQGLIILFKKNIVARNVYGSRLLIDITSNFWIIIAANKHSILRGKYE